MARIAASYSFAMPVFHSYAVAVACSLCHRHSRASQLRHHRFDLQNVVERYPDDVRDSGSLQSLFTVAFQLHRFLNAFVPGHIRIDVFRSAVEFTDDDSAVIGLPQKINAVLLSGRRIYDGHLQFRRREAGLDHCASCIGFAAVFAHCVGMTDQSNDFCAVAGGE